jgi:hypothetical protein
MLSELGLRRSGGKGGRQALGQARESGGIAMAGISGRPSLRDRTNETAPPGTPTRFGENRIESSTGMAYTERQQACCTVLHQVSPHNPACNAAREYQFHPASGDTEISHPYHLTVFLQNILEVRFITAEYSSASGRRYALFT